MLDFDDSRKFRELIENYVLWLGLKGQQHVYARQVYEGLKETPIFKKIIQIYGKPGKGCQKHYSAVSRVAATLKQSEFTRKYGLCPSCDPSAGSRWVCIYEIVL